MSIAGCLQQEAHCDFIPKRGMTSPAQAPYFVILALQPNTRLVIWPKSHLLMKDLYETGKCDREDTYAPQVVEIPVGSALVAHQLLVHAGAEYPEENYRFHAFLEGEKKEDHKQTFKASVAIAEDFSSYRKLFKF